MVFASSAPSLPGALGTFELAVVEVLELWGIPCSLGIGYGFVLHLVLVLPREGILFLRVGPSRRAATDGPSDAANPSVAPDGPSAATP